MQKRFRPLILLSATVIGGVFVFGAVVLAVYGDTTTFVGTPYDGDGGAASSALLDFAEDVTSNGSGTFAIADTFNQAIRKVSGGTITTLAGGGYGSQDGTGSAAGFSNPRGVAFDGAGNVYVADAGNNAIRKITSAGVVTTLVNTGLAGPYGVTVAGSTVFIADTGNDALKSVPTAGGSVTTITSGLNDPKKIDATADGATVYVADNGSHRVLKVTVGTGAVAVVAGSGSNAYQEGTGASASFQNVLGVTLSADEATLYVSDGDGYLTDRIRTVNTTSGATALFSSDVTQQQMIFPAGSIVDSGRLYVAMSGLGIVRSYNVSNAADTSIFAGSARFGNRNGTNALFGRPHDLALSHDRSTLFVAENNQLRAIDVATASASYITGSNVDNYRDGLPIGPGVAVQDEARFSTIAGIVVTDNEQTLYVTDRWNNRIRKINLSVSPVTTALVTGAGRKNSTGSTVNGYQEGVRCTHEVDRNDAITLQAGCAYFEQPTGIVLDPTEQYLYVADTANHRIRKIVIGTGQTTLIAGGSAGYVNGTGSAARFNTPWGLAINDAGTRLYVADRENHRIRVIDLATNAVTSLAGAGSAGYQEGIGSSAFFSFPEYVKMGADGKLYVTEVGSHRIRQVDPATGLTKLVAGSGTRGYLNGAKTAARFDTLEGLAPDTSGGGLYVADSANDVIRKVDVVGAAPFTDPAPTVTRVEPTEVQRNWAVQGVLNVKIVGTGFRYGATAYFYTYPATKTYVISSTEIVATLPLSSMSAGWYDVKVANTDGQFGTVEAALGLRSDTTFTVPGTFYSISEANGFYAYAPTLRGGYYLATGNTWGDGKEEIIVGTGTGFGPQVRVFSNDGSVRGSFFAYSSALRTGVRVASCDLNGDGRDEIVTAPGPGGRPHIRVLDRNGTPTVNPGFFALDGKFLGGANVACGDVTGDGIGEIIVAASKGGGPHVTVHRADGSLLGNFFAYGATFRAGIFVGVVDLNGDGIQEIVTGPEQGAPHVQIFRGDGTRLSPGFFAFSPTFRGGISVAGGDTDNDGKDNIVIAPGSAAQARVKVYNTNGNIIYGQFLAYPRVFEGGARVAAGDVNGDGIDDIVTVPASGFAPSVRMFKQDGTSL